MKRGGKESGKTKKETLFIVRTELSHLRTVLNLIDSQALVDALERTEAPQCEKRNGAKMFVRNANYSLETADEAIKRLLEQSNQRNDECSDKKNVIKLLLTFFFSFALGITSALIFKL